VSDTDRTVSSMAYTPDLDRLLTDGGVFRDEHATFVIEPHLVGDVVLPTGQVVGCDPLVSADSQPPFTVTVAPGSYALRAWVAVLYQTERVEWQRRVAALELVIRPEAAARWELALIDGNDPDELTGDEFFGYGVDAGTGTLADLTAIRALADWDYDRIEDVYIPAVFPERPVPGAIGAVTHEQTGANVITASSGWGDGAYPTFIGYTAQGDVASFVTDFLVVPRGEERAEP